MDPKEKEEKTLKENPILLGKRKEKKLADAAKIKEE